MMKKLYLAPVVLSKEIKSILEEYPQSIINRGLNVTFLLVIIVIGLLYFTSYTASVSTYLRAGEAPGGFAASVPVNNKNWAKPGRELRVLSASDTAIFRISAVAEKEGSLELQLLPAGNTPVPAEPGAKVTIKVKETSLLRKLLSNIYPI